jgi:hypothetical protein
MTQTDIKQQPTSAQIARKCFVAKQVAIVAESQHPQASRWQNAIIRAGEAFVAGKEARKEMVERCEAYNTTVAQCDCEAGKHGNPCKHRAFQRLLEKWANE